VAARGSSVLDTVGSPVSSPGGGDRAPQVIVDSGARSVVLTAWTWDTPSALYDGTAPANPADLGAVSIPVNVDVDSPGWVLAATIIGPSCELNKTVEPGLAPGGSVRLGWTGPAGRYVVTLDGDDGAGRTLHVTFAAHLTSAARCA